MRGGGGGLVAAGVGKSLCAALGRHAVKYSAIVFFHALTAGNALFGIFGC